VDICIDFVPLAYHKCASRKGLGIECIPLPAPPNLFGIFNIIILYVNQIHLELTTIAPNYNLVCGSIRVWSFGESNLPINGVEEGVESLNKNKSIDEVETMSYRSTKLRFALARSTKRKDARKKRERTLSMMR
jgi:hypothetical protein